MSNPMMNDKAVDEAARAPGWGAPTATARSTVIPGVPIDDGPISGWQSNAMTIRGTMTAGGVLLVLLLGSATFGWASAPDAGGGAGGFPAMALVAVLVGFGCAIALHFKPMMAKVLGPIYALAQGFFLGAFRRRTTMPITGSSYRPSAPRSVSSRSCSSSTRRESSRSPIGSAAT